MQRSKLTAAQQRLERLAVEHCINPTDRLYKKPNFSAYFFGFLISTFGLSLVVSLIVLPSFVFSTSRSSISNIVIIELIIIGCCSLPVLLTIFLVLIAQYRGKATTLINEDGLVAIKKQETYIIHWHDIMEELKIYECYNTKNGERHWLTHYYVYTQDGKELDLKVILSTVGGDAKETLVNRFLIPLLLRRYLPQALETYTSGQVVTFGMTGVSKQGISLRNGWKLVPWEQIKLIKIEPWAITIEPIDKITQVIEEISSAATPNMSVLVELLRCVQDPGKLQLSKRMLKQLPTNRE